MNSESACPKCKKTNIHLGKKGMSLTKAAGGFVVAGAVGTLAGLHGSGNIGAICLSCGCKWDPIKFNKEESRKRELKAAAAATKWKTRFVYLYENGEIEKATSIAKNQRGAMYEREGLETVYKNVKSDLNGEMVVKVITWVIMGSIIFGFVYMCS